MEKSVSGAIPVPPVIAPIPSPLAAQAEVKSQPSVEDLLAVIADLKAKLEAKPAQVAVAGSSSLEDEGIPLHPDFPHLKKGQSIKYAGPKIKVVAKMDGFYGGHRRVIDEKFEINHPGEIGDWMKVI